MTTIDLKFAPDMRAAAIAGNKILTTRDEPKGSPGDVFALDPVLFRLLDVLPVPLDAVKTLYYRLEGFESPAAFEKRWRELHRGHYTVSKTYYAHYFARCPA